MPPLNIPKRYIPGFKRFIALSPDESEELYSVVSELKPDINVNRLIANIADNVATLPQSETKAIMRMLVSLYDLREQDQKPTEETVGEIARVPI